MKSPPELKVMLPEIAARADARERFRREARTAARLSHPHIVPLHTFGEVSGLVYFVMGYIAGASKLRMDTFVRFAYLGALISSVTFVTFGYFVGRHIPWGYSRIALIAIAAGVVFTASGLPLRMALRMKNMAAAAIANRANRPSEVSTQLACEPKK